MMFIQCFFGEVPFFFLSGKLLKAIGHIQAMNLVLIGFSLRLFLYSLLTNPWYALPIELLNGITFGVFYSTMVRLFDNKSKFDDNLIDGNLFSRPVMQVLLLHLELKQLCRYLFTRIEKLLTTFNETN